MLWDIMNDNISDIELREKVNQVSQSNLMHREITLDTKGQFPTKETTSLPMKSFIRNITSPMKKSTS